MVWRSFHDQKSLKYCAVTYVIEDLNGEEIVGTFFEKDNKDRKSNNEKRW